MNIHVKFVLAFFASLLFTAASVLLVQVVPFHGYALLPFFIPIIIFGFCTFGLFLDIFQSSNAKQQKLRDFGDNWFDIIFWAILRNL